MTAAHLHEIALHLAAFGRKFAIVNGTILVAIFVYLMVLVIRKGARGKDQGHVVTRRGIVVDPGSDLPATKQKVFYSREKFVTMASLVKGTASREDWCVAIGVNVCILSFMLMFLGIGLTILPEGRELGFAPGALVFIAFPFIFITLLIKFQYSDYKETREKLERKRLRATERA